MLKVMFGEEPYLISQMVEKKAEGLSEMNVTWSDTLDDTVIQTVQQFPFLSDRRLVIAEVGRLTCERLCEVSVPEFTEFIVLVKEVDKRTSLYKRLSRMGCMEEFKKLEPAALKKFVNNTVKKCGCTMEADVVDYFIRHIGYLVDAQVTLYTVQTALEQLAFASGVIRVADVDALVPRSMDVKMWQLSDVLLDLDKKRLFDMAGMLLEEKESPIGMLSLLLRTFRLAYKASLFRGVKGVHVSKELGVPDFHYQKAMRFDSGQISGCLDVLQGGVNKIKDGAPDRVVFFSTLGQVLLMLGGAA